MMTEGKSSNALSTAQQVVQIRSIPAYENGFLVSDF